MAESTDLAGITRKAYLSDCGRYRFSLQREWGEGPSVAWLMLNPSTADAEQDDPTLRRIQDWAARWGYHGVVVVNVFPFRASKPSALWRWREQTDADRAVIAVELVGETQPFGDALAIAGELFGLHRWRDQRKAVAAETRHGIRSHVAQARDDEP